MLTRLGRFAVRRRRLVLVTSLLFVMVGGLLGAGVVPHLSTGGFQDPGSESTRALEVLDKTFRAGSPNLILLVTAAKGTVDDPAVARAGTALTLEVGGERGVSQATSYWTLGNPPPLRSGDGKQALVLARLAGNEDEIRELAERLSPRYTRDDGTIRVRVGGQAEVLRQITDQVEKDLERAEVITFPVILLLLVVVFGSVVAAGLPLGVGAVAVVGTLLILRVLATLTDVSVFALNLTTGLGLGLGIDYSLFIVSRFREELRRGLSPGDAAVRTVETAGRTVAFSALTVAVSLAALMAFPLQLMRSFGYAGMAVVAIAALGALVFLPALLAVLGSRVDKWSLRRRGPAPAIGEGRWHRIAMFVMRHPVPMAAGVIAFLLLLGAPFLGVRFGLFDDRVLGRSVSSRQVQDQIRANFSSEEAAALAVVAPAAGEMAAETAEIDRYATELSRLPGVARVDAVTGFYAGGARLAPAAPISARFAAPGGTGTWLSVVPTLEPISEKAEKLVAQIRDVRAPFDVLVGGPSAELVDVKASLFGRIGVAVALIALVTFVVLFMMTGSVVVPIKATILNLMSLSATYGAMVWIFQEGHLSGLLGFTPTGFLDTVTPILMFCVAFGLSMDYEVFLLSRIKEEYDSGNDNVTSVARGLERTGRIVTAAAALLAVVFLAFVTSQVTFVKAIGVGMMLAVLMDATLIRATLVPAFMRLAGDANWWAPAPMKRFHDRFGLKESEGHAQGPGVSRAAGGGPIGAWVPPYLRVDEPDPKRRSRTRSLR